MRAATCRSQEPEILAANASVPRLVGARSLTCEATSVTSVTSVTTVRFQRWYSSAQAPIKGRHFEQGCPKWRFVSFGVQVGGLDVISACNCWRAQDVYLARASHKPRGAGTIRVPRTIEASVRTAAAESRRPRPMPVAGHPGNQEPTAQREVARFARQAVQGRLAISQLGSQVRARGTGSATRDVEKRLWFHRALLAIASLRVWVNVPRALMTDSEAEAPIALGACSCWRCCGAGKAANIKITQRWDNEAAAHAEAMKLTRGP